VPVRKKVGGGGGGNGPPPKRRRRGRVSRVGRDAGDRSIGRKKRKNHMICRDQRKSQVGIEKKGRWETQTLKLATSPQVSDGVASSSRNIWVQKASEGEKEQLSNPSW